MSTKSSKINLAKEQCKIPKGNFKPLEEKHISFFKHILEEVRVLTNLKDLDTFNEHYFKLFKGSCSLVLLPKTTEEISKILSYCNENSLAICVQGGNTSVPGGSIAIYDEIILSLSLMNNIVEFDEYSDVIICEAGCVLGNLQNFLKDKQLMMPVDLASRNHCFIGGNVATNAGGLKVLKYGNMHASVLGLEVVKANGEILDCLNTLKKDNSGYHLKNLFIGSEGTLGVITKVAIQCVTLPKHFSVAFLGLDSFDKVLKTYKYAKNQLNETLSSCEMMDYQAVDMVQSHLKIKNALGNYPFYMLVETSGNNKEYEEDKLNTFLKKCFENKLIVDGIMSTDSSKCEALWEVRNRYSESIQYDGYVLMYDLSFPLKNFYTIVPEMATILKNKCTRVSGLGHLGDGNLHFQVSLQEYNENIKEFIDDIVYKRTAELKGSMSAEHGIGFVKTDLLHYSKSDSCIKLMREIKTLLDPNGILNPYKVIKM